MAFKIGAKLTSFDVARLLESRGIHLTANRLRELGRASDRGSSISADELPTWYRRGLRSKKGLGHRKARPGPQPSRTNPGFRDAPTSPVARASRPRPLFGSECSRADRQLSARGTLNAGGHVCGQRVQPSACLPIREGMENVHMWEPYLRTALPAPKEKDRARLEALAGGPLPPGYWELATAHQGDALDQDLVEDAAFESLVLLLVLPPERLGKSEISYSIAFAMEHTMPRYPVGLFPFADDTGGNLWAFDYRANPANPAIVFIDHELEGEEGVTTVAPDFATLLARVGVSGP